MGTEWWLIHIDDLTPQSVWKVYGYSFPCEKYLIRLVCGSLKLPSVNNKVRWRKTHLSDVWTWLMGLSSETFVHKQYAPAAHLLHIIRLHQFLLRNFMNQNSHFSPCSLPLIHESTSFTEASSKLFTYVNIWSGFYLLILVFWSPCFIFSPCWLFRTLTLLRLLVPRSVLHLTSTNSYMLIFKSSFLPPSKDKHLGSGWLAILNYP